MPLYVRHALRVFISLASIPVSISLIKRKLWKGTIGARITRAYRPFQRHAGWVLLRVVGLDDAVMLACFANLRLVFGTAFLVSCRFPVGTVTSAASANMSD